jgi:hypothetical protein
VSSALDALDRAGYEVSEYRDKGGRLTINASNIEQIVAADRLTYRGTSSGDRPKPHVQSREKEESATWTSP